MRMDARPKADIHGILLLDKRAGVSSNRAMQEVKRLFCARKAGHTGSLDPLATGLLPICFGAATKISGMLLDDDKRYQTVIQLGTKTDTGDLEGNILESKPVPALSLIDIESVLAQFRGPIFQIPPMYSALKQGGKKLYEIARAGQVVERKARPVSIYELKLLDFRDNLLSLDVFCSKGTYIRTLAEDIGDALGCGATVSALRRIQSGGFSIDQALPIEQLMDLQIEDLKQRLINVDAPLQMLPSVHVDEAQAIKIRHGQYVDFDMESGHEDHASLRMYCNGEFLGLGEMRMDGKLAPKKLFNLNGF